MKCFGRKIYEVNDGEQKNILLNETVFSLCNYYIYRVYFKILLIGKKMANLLLLVSILRII